ncbi:MAG: hypothetical protein ACRDOS_02285 [Gaiellaceae bacterium]
MAHRVFFLNKLREGVHPSDYERWVREVDYPFARSIPSIESYVVSRAASLLGEDGKPPYDFIEVVEVTDLAAYEADLSTDKPEVQEFDKEWLSYVGEAVAVVGEVIE